MSGPRSRHASALLVAAMLSLAARGALAQVPVHLVPGQGEAGADYLGYRLADQDDTGVRSYQLREWLRIPIAGALIHPKILAYDLLLQPTFMQLQTGDLELLRRVGARQLSYSTAFRALTGTQWPVYFNSSRGSGTTRGDFGEQRDLTYASQELQFLWTNPYLPARLELLRRSTDDAWRAPFATDVFRRADRQREARLSAHNSKVDLVLRQVRFQEERSGWSTDWRTADLDHRFAWGKGSLLTTDGQYEELLGAGGNRQASWQQFAHIQHTPTAFSLFGYDLLHATAAGATTTAQQVSEQFSTTPWPSFTASLDARASHHGYDGGGETGYSIGPAANVNRRIFGVISLSYGGSVTAQRYRYANRTVSAAVVDERHVVDSTGRITLSQSGVDTTTIQVTSDDHVVIYAPGIDYRVAGGGAVTELYIVPGGRIALSDTLLVTYRFTLPTARSYGAVTYGYALAAGAFGASAYYSAYESSAQGGDDAFSPLALANSRTRGVRLIRSFARSTVNIFAERRELYWRVTSYVTDELTGAVTLPFTSWFTARGGGSAIRSITNGRPLTSRSASAGTSLLAGSFRLDADLRTWAWLPENAPRETLLGGGVRLSYWRENTSVFGGIDRQARTDGVRREVTNLSSGLTRRF